MTAGRHRAQPLRRALDVLEADGHVGMEALSRLGQPDTAVFAQEQRSAQLLFKPRDGVGDRRLRHPQLARGGAEAGQPPGSLEHHETVQGGQELAQVFHKPTLST